MKNKLYAIPVKAVAVILALLVAIATAAAAIACGVMIREDFYSRPEQAIRQDAFRSMLEQKNHEAFFYAIDLEAPGMAAELSENYYYQILDETGAVVAGNYADQPVQLSQDSVLWQEYYLEDEEVFQERQYTVVGYLAAELRGSDQFTQAQDWIGWLYPLRYWSFGLALLGLLAEVALLIYLFCGAGNRPGEDAPRLGPLDKIPFDVATAALILLAVLEIYWMGGYLGGGELAFWLAVCGIADYLLLLWYFLSLAARLKVGGLFRSTLLGRLFLPLGKGLRHLFTNLPLVWKTALAVSGITLLELLVLLAVWEKGVLLLFWFWEKAVLVPLVILIAIALRKLQKGGETLAAGRLEERLDTGYLFGDLRRFGQTLNSIGDGMNKAVEERMKSERFKTELITNVSHDIKTPLTSIINYVDLIKKEEPEDEKIRQYTEVLDRQSARLKKLIEDLVEASKASTGNLPVHPEPCDTGVLLTQMAGEYDERFREKGLDPILQLPEIPITVLADPRHLWRILDNLMGNIVKYAQSGTRVYLDLFAGDREIAILFRNISQAPLHISGEELMERFVRGDSSRNTEGSGLGLSIARSLAELQGGSMQIEVDGDLFKVTLRFPRLR